MSFFDKDVGHHIKSIVFGWCGLLVLCFPLVVKADIFCNSGEEKCWFYRGGGKSSAPAYPTQNSSIQINPAAVPTEKGLGIEGIFYGSSPDFSIVKGNGRVGAAISPSNGEESFFGPPGFEYSGDYLNRKIARHKYQSQKYTLATAVNLLDNKKKSLQRFQLNLGVIGKYNRETEHTLPGGGITGVAGPVTFGYSYSKDETRIDYASLGLDFYQDIPFATEVVTIGLFLNSLAVDYSYLREYVEGSETTQVVVLTASLLLQRWILTLATRSEKSTRQAYDPETKTLVDREVKGDLFAGLQFSLGKKLMVGCFYNYYLLYELSAGLTLFF